MTELILSIVGDIANIAGAIGALVALYELYKMRKEREKENEIIKIKLMISDSESENNNVELPLHLKRREITRAEIFGRVGSIRTEGNKRFSLKFLSTQEFYKRLNTVTNSESDVLTIDVTMSEMEQFILD